MRQSLSHALKFIKSIGLLAVMIPMTSHAFTFMRGVNIMDMGIGMNAPVPGVYNTNYTTTSLADLKLIASRGYKVIRITVSWERLQRCLTCSLDSGYLNLVLDQLRNADKAGLKVILDLHNYARYFVNQGGTNIETIFGDVLAPKGPTDLQFANLWKALSYEIRRRPEAYKAIYAYDLMNEPYGIPDFYPNLTQRATISTFETGLEGWQVKSGSVSLSRPKRNNQYSLALTVPRKARPASDYFSITLPRSARAIAKGSGNVLRIHSYIPTTTEGTFEVRLYAVDGNSKSYVSGTTAYPRELIRKGRDGFYFNLQIPSEGLINTGALTLEFRVYGSEGTSTANQVVYIDDITQGTADDVERGVQIWQRYAQAAVTGLRVQGDKTLVMVEGYNFASAAAWPTLQPKKFINDPVNNMMYQAHLYLDTSTGGSYTQTFAQETADAKAAGFASVAARAVWRASQFVNWCTAQNVRCFIGEYGWPNSDHHGVAEARQWDVVGEALLDYLDSKKMGATAWGTGSWLSAKDNELNMYVLTQQGRAFDVLSNAEVVEKHPTK